MVVNRAKPCGHCLCCQEGRHNHCLDMRFIGSAIRIPHIQGGFREDLVVQEGQTVPVADGVSMGEAAMGDPLAVCLMPSNVPEPCVVDEFL